MKTQHSLRANGKSNRKTLITGGAGFIGSNLAHALAAKGHEVHIYDNLSRSGVELNLRDLMTAYPDRVVTRISDMRDSKSLELAVAEVDEIYHFAAQVAVTTSVRDPVEDLEVNLLGTFRLLEAIRRTRRWSYPSLLFTSTNKVFGSLDGFPLRETDRRFEAVDPEISKYGFNGQCGLHFCSPYGCSKGAADQYVVDYAKTYGIPTVVFRMSCIYGPRQFGTEDQGWLAHFLIKAMQSQELTIYGNGKQVRDLLFVDDLVEALQSAMEKSSRLAGSAFAIGGGPENSRSLLECVREIEELLKHPIGLKFLPERIGDQKFFVTDYRAFEEESGWKPRVSPHEGMRRLYRWLMSRGFDRVPRPLQRSTMATPGAAFKFQVS
jgi:CDP-paratose 2-epimerase